MNAETLRRLIKPLLWLNLNGHPDFGGATSVDTWIADGLHDEFSLAGAEDGLIHFWEVGEDEPEGEPYAYATFEKAKAAVERYNQDKILELFELPEPVLQPELPA